MKYITLMRDIKRWYSWREGGDGTALFTAVLLLSVLACVNIISVVGIIEEVVYGRLFSFTTNKGPKLVLIGAVILIHIAIAKRERLSEDAEVGNKVVFPPSARVYVLLTAITFSLFILSAVLHRISAN